MRRTSRRRCEGAHDPDKFGLAADIELPHRGLQLAARRLIRDSPPAGVLRKRLARRERQSKLGLPRGKSERRESGCRPADRPWSDRISAAIGFGTKPAPAERASRGSTRARRREPSGPNAGKALGGATCPTLGTATADAKAARKALWSDVPGKASRPARSSTMRPAARHDPPKSFEAATRASESMRKAASPRLAQPSSMADPGPTAAETRRWTWHARTSAGDAARRIARPFSSNAPCRRDRNVAITIASPAPTGRMPAAHQRAST